MAHGSQIELKETSSWATVGPAKDKQQAPTNELFEFGDHLQIFEWVMTLLWLSFC